MQTVTVKRSPISNAVPTEIKPSTKLRIGNFLKNGVPNRFLSEEEEVNLLPLRLQISPSDTNFSFKVAEFYSNYTYTLTGENEKILDITLNDKNNPVNIKDYLDYKFLSNHTRVGTKEEDLKNPAVYLILITSERVKLENEEKAKKITLAMEEFQKINSDREKLDAVYREIFGKNPRKIKDINEVVYELQKLVFESPDLIIKTTTSTNLKTKYFIFSCVDYNIIQVIADSSYLYGDIVLGNSLDETILFLKDTRNLDTKERIVKSLQLAISSVNQ